jgi:hypothetical protein
VFDSRAVGSTTGDNRWVAASTVRPTAEEGATRAPTVSADDVRSAAARLGLSPRLRRLTAEGLLARPYGVGRGRGRGREYCYPARALDQLAEVAEGLHHGHRYVALRHRLWWTPGGRLEDWEFWRRDRLREVAVQVAAWDMPPAVNGELPDEREQHLVEVARQVRASRLPGLPTRKREAIADTETFVRVFTSVQFRDDMLDPVDAPPASTWAEQIRALATQPVDTDEGSPVGRSIGELFDRGIGWTGRGVPGVLPGVAALAWAHFIPTPRLAAALLTTLTADEAAHLRDATIHWARLTGTADVLRRQPLIALVVSMTCGMVAFAHPRIVEVPAPAP